MTEEHLPHHTATSLQELASLRECIIFDLEYTAWPGSMEHRWNRPGEVREIFQIGLLHARRDSQSQLRSISATSILIKTTIVPQLPEYSVHLTGITPQMILEHGIPFASALDMLHTYARNGDIPLVSYGADRDVIAENCSLLKVQPPHFAAGFINSKKAIHLHDPRTKTLSSGQLYTLASSWNGKAEVHNALHDVQSLFAYLHEQRV